MSAANYALCDSCDGKVFYVGDADIPLGTVVTHVECQLRELAKVRADTWREAIEALREDDRYAAWDLAQVEPRTPLQAVHRDVAADYLETLSAGDAP